MTNYHHIASKEKAIAGMVENVFTAIELPTTDTDWKTAMRCPPAHEEMHDRAIYV